MWQLAAPLKKIANIETHVNLIHFFYRESKKTKITATSFFWNLNYMSTLNSFETEENSYFRWNRNKKF
jgi:hypothetical protein